MNTRTSFKGRLRIDSFIPDHLSIDSTLFEWMNEGIITSFNTSKRGAYCVTLNDGDKTKRDRYLKEKTNYSLRDEYEATCTRIFPENPTALATLDFPSLEDLRKLADRKHYITDDARIIMKPYFRNDNSEEGNE